VVNYFSRVRFFVVTLAALGLVTFLGLNVATAFPQSQKTAAAAGDKAAAASVENGRKAFLQHGCFSCHGYSGEGGRGARLVQNPIPADVFAQYVREPKRNMPPFGTQVSEQELTDMYAFLKSIPASPNAKSIPLLTNP
jgi:mono/diheme cytochrome c family protein